MTAATNHLDAVCDLCFELVNALTVEMHMDQHGLLLPNDWRFKVWPGTNDEQVCIDWTLL